MSLAVHYHVDAMPRFVQTEPGVSPDLFDLVVRVRLDRSISTPSLRVRWGVSPQPLGEPCPPVEATTPMGVDYYRGLLRDEASAPPPQGVPADRPPGIPSRPYAVITLPPFAPGEDGRGGFTYLEATIPRVAAGSDVTYGIDVEGTADSGNGATVEVALGPYVVRAPQPDLDAPELAAGDRVGGRSGSLTDSEPVWIARVRRSPGVVQVVVDLDDIPVSSPDSTIPVRVKVDGTWQDADPAALHRREQEVRTGQAGPFRAVRLPLVDVNTDRVTFTIPSEDEAAPVLIEVYGRQVREGSLAPGGQTPGGQTRVLITHFAIQALNDLFARPLADYTPPRTYMQVTMRDEDGRYSSRPAIAASGVGDGYCYGFDAHRRFGVRYHLALNGPLLTMIAHDCPTPVLADGTTLHAGLDTIRRDVAAGLLHPMLPGFGSFRWRWFSGRTLARDVEMGREQQQHLLHAGRGSRSPHVLYPDSRIYVQTPEYVESITSLGLRYVVLDSSTGYYGNEDTIELHPGRAIDAGPNHLWQDRETGLRILFIDDSLKDTVYADDGTRWELGKPPLEVRRRLIRFALDPHLRDNLLCYGDDYEKACSNGWFDGQGPLKERFSAFLEWVSAHSWWLRVVTAADLEAEEPVGTIDIRSSLEPTMDPGGALSTDLNGNRFHIDTWIETWASYPAVWRGGTLGGITKQVEQALIAVTDTTTSDAAAGLVKTAWLAFVTGNHEQAWMKQSLEAGDANRTPIGDPESFTVSSGLQMRNVLVWLKAAVWAEWASTAGAQDEAAYASGGPLAARIRGLRRRPGSDALGGLGEAHPLFDPVHWDADPLSTPYLYNRHALVVLDRNGGVASHAFVLDPDGRARTVSGTFKTYQFRTDDGLFADGMVMQNTVWTPNHRYIGSIPSTTEGPRTVEVADLRTGANGNVDHTIMVNNFDAYAVAPRRTVPAHRSIESAQVAFTYVRGEAAPAKITREELETLLRRDGVARAGGTTARPVVWHTRPGSLVKRFTLTGRTLGVDIEGLQPDDVVETEVCVDLLEGVMKGTSLRRTHTSDSVTVTVAGRRARGSGRGVRLRIIEGGMLTRASLLDTLAEAARTRRVSDYLELHRVLTEAVQIIPTSSSLSYELDLQIGD